MSIDARTTVYVEPDEPMNVDFCESEYYDGINIVDPRAGHSAALVRICARPEAAPAFIEKMRAGLDQWEKHLQRLDDLRAQERLDEIAEQDALAGAAEAEAAAASQSLHAMYEWEHRPGDQY